MGNDLITDRVILEENIPLRIPICIYIDTTNACNFSCSFCPTGNHLQKMVDVPTGLMSMETFQKIVNDCKNFVLFSGKKIKQLNLFHLGEPFLNKNLIKMVRYAHSEKIADEIFISTNGSRLSPEISEDLVTSGLDTLSISMYGTNDQEYSKLN